MSPRRSRRRWVSRRRWRAWARTRSRSTSRRSRWCQDSCEPRWAIIGQSSGSNCGGIGSGPLRATCSRWRAQNCRRLSRYWRRSASRRTASGELVERDLGLPVAVIAGGDVVGAGGLAVVAAGLAAIRPAVRCVAPRGEVAAPRVGAEQLLRRRAVLAEGVVGDLEPVVARLSGAWPLVVRRDGPGAGLAGVGDGVGEALVEADQGRWEPAQHVGPPSARVAN